VLGPADKAGKIVVSGAELLAHAWRNCRLFVMDYADPAAHFAGSVDVKPVTPDRVQEMKEAYGKFKRYFDYPEAWDRTLEDLAAWFARHQVSTLAVTVTVTPTVIRVTAVEIQV